MPVNVEKQVAYWRQGAQEDAATARLLFQHGKNKEALFFAHLAMEKALKALVVKATGDLAPYSHDLPYLAEKARIELAPEQSEFVGWINQFAIRGRYPELERPLPSPAQIGESLNQTEEILQWLIQKL